MYFKPHLRPLPESARRQSLAQFMHLVDTHPDLAHLRIAVPTGPQRQLALIAALERHVIVGPPAAAPPDIQNPADMLLCDLLDCLERDPEITNHGSAYGPDRQLANLQALGYWRGRSPINRPTARDVFLAEFSKTDGSESSELITTPPSSVTPDATQASQSSAGNLSPLCQITGPNGDLIAAFTDQNVPAEGSACAAETVVSRELTKIPAGSASEENHGLTTGINHHPPQPSGDEFPVLAIDTARLPARPVRRGRPAALDDIAKGRLLGLMSFGLSLRQAAAQLGVHHTTILGTMKRDEAFTQQIAEARLDAISQPLLCVVRASRTNWRAAAWLAKYLDERRSRTYETTPEEREVENLKRRSRS